MKISLVFVIAMFLVVGGYVVEIQRAERDYSESVPPPDVALGQTGNDVKMAGLPLPAILDEGNYQAGDMMLDEDQWEIVRALENDVDLSKRKALADISKRWPNNQIPYYVNVDVESYYATDIASVVANYEQHTCLDFIKHTSPPSSGGYVNVKSGSGCFSKVGYKNTNRNLALKLGSCRSSIPHEFGHAIGFKHEHMRPDRDSFVTVRTANIKSGYESAFTKFTADVVNTFNIPYDYKSYMHYQSNAFSSNGEPTIVSTNPMDMIDLGANEDPDFYDIKMINLMYECSDGCSAATCNNGGYQDKTCNCVCPPEWTGSDCSTSVTLPDDCKNTITGGSGDVTSANYPSNYPADHICQWYIKGTAAGQTITVNFVDFELEDPYVGVCDDDFLEIRESDLYFGGVKYCGTTAPATQVVTSSTAPPEMLIVFQADTNSIVKKGFKFTYSIV